jgi:hypothetical protein
MPNVQLKLEVSPTPTDIFWWAVTVGTNPPLVLESPPAKDFSPLNSAGFYVWDKPIQVNGATLNIQFHISPLASSAVADCYVTIDTVPQVNHVLKCTAAAIADQFDYTLPVPSSSSLPNPAPTP